MVMMWMFKFPSFLQLHNTILLVYHIKSQQNVIVGCNLTKCEKFKGYQMFCEAIQTNLKCEVSKTEFPFCLVIL